MKKQIQIVIPMAGFGSRLRPLTWSKPKPLINLAGRTSLDFLLDEFKSLENEFDAEYIFIISPNGWEIQSFMEEHYPHLRCKFVVQEEMKGQSHAILLAKEHLHGPMIMTFSDTLLEGDLGFLANEDADGVAWIQWNPEPQRFGVAITRKDGSIERFIEKPPTDEHKMVIIGFYYFRDGQRLISAIEEQIREDVSLKGEYYIADAINIMIRHGGKFIIRETNLWLDSGVPDTVFSTNRYYLENGFDNTEKASKRQGVLLKAPVFIADDAIVENSIIGPHVSIASGCEIRNSIISNSIIAENTMIEQQVIQDSLIGADVTIQSKPSKYFLGDNTRIEPA